MSGCNFRKSKQILAVPCLNCMKKLTEEESKKPSVSTILRQISNNSQRLIIIN